VGAIVLSSLGYGRFDEEDRRLLEVLASHAAVAIVNARLFQAEREAAETSSALLRLSQALTGLRSVAAVVQEAVDTVPSVVACAAAAAYVQDDRSGAFRLVRLLSLDETVARAPDDVADVPDAEAAALGFTGTEPRRLDAGALPGHLAPVAAPRETIVAPLRWGPAGAGALVLAAADPASTFEERDVRVARGVADIASLALGNAERLSELQRFHELVESVDAVFWEAAAADLRFTFVGGRCEELLGPDAARWAAEGRTWGSHVREDDRDRAVGAVRSAVDAAADASVEYPVEAPDGGTRWIRDLVHVVRGDRGPTELRGLMVDITERRLAEEALAHSERRHSEAFRREREAAQRLRALDEMKNTFLEAVSHDLRTPLTSILGSALTLEQTRLDLPRADALDLVRRIATNARKLERLLGDLLDLDRLQRGIVGPQRRAVDLATLIATGVAETENPARRRIEVDVEPATVSVDAAKVERILENLLSNALRHTPPGARIWVRARADDGGCTIVVEDDGPGVPDGFKDAVFEPFRQAPGSSSGHAPGVGIGLSLVRRFAELHGGRAWVADREGGGASFHVRLPGAPRRERAEAGQG
jgi:PAS domain S-box-containing protein